MGDDRHGGDRTELRPPGDEPTKVRAGLALAGVLAAVLLVAVSVLSTTATVNAASHPPIQAQQAADVAIPDTESMSNEELATLLASAERTSGLGVTGGPNPYAIASQPRTS